MSGDQPRLRRFGEHLMPDQETHSGGCMCGAVTYVTTGKLRPVLDCHCRQCARWTGNSVMATASRTENLTIQGQENLTWFASSDHAERGFCKQCGSKLFWRLPNIASVSIMAGSMTNPTGLHIAAHLFVADKSDYDIIGNDATQFPGSRTDA